MNRDLCQLVIADVPSLPSAMDVELQSGKVSKAEPAALGVVMIVAVGSWRTPWSPMVHACDSSLDGSIGSSVWAVSDLRETGLRKEGGRWKLGAERARQQSLEAAGFLVGVDDELERNAEG